MAGMDLSADDEPIAAINIVPFVDVVLVLLIIFMLTSAAIVKTSFKVDLPKVSSGGAAMSSTFEIFIKSNGDLLMRDKPISLVELASFTQQEIGLDPKTQVVITADKLSAYGRVIEVIDTIRLHGVQSYALSVREEAKP